MISKEQLKSAIDLVKGAINKTQPPALQPGSTTGPQRSIESKARKLHIHFEDTGNVLRSLQQDSPSTMSRILFNVRSSPLLVEVRHPRATERRSVRMHGPYSPGKLAAMEA